MIWIEENIWIKDIQREEVSIMIEIEFLFFCVVGFGVRLINNFIQKKII